MTETETGGLAPGAQIVVRDEVWLVRNCTRTEHDGDKIRAIGISGLVRDQEATFFTELDKVQLLQPEETRLVADASPQFRASRLFLEAALRRTPLPQSERRLAMAEKFLLKRNPYQQRPAEMALANLRPRLLIADVVGLGKTMEIGLALAELIRRGRGERILVVTPQQILDQFQRELWTRFSIPLVRLDSVGIQRIQREIPAGRNPFTYFKRVIISIDTLKSVGKYRHHLENIHWDAVVIDESHNLFGGSSFRAQLAKVLAPRTDALLLASATPHNGDRASFAELIDLLDPAAIADRDNYKPGDIEHLYIRRTKISPEVRDHVKDNWADRRPSVPIRCAATTAEERIFAELTERWLAKDSQLGTGKDRKLFPYNLMKSFLSSHRALSDTVTARLKTLAGRISTQDTEPERIALERLRDLADGVTDDGSAKLAALVTKLTEIGVGPGSTTRVVVFSERVPTLKWLAKTLPGRLGFRGKSANTAVQVLHGGVSDQQEQEILEQFRLASTPVRVLLTGDVASEGVNLHDQCHHLIHYDLPWSLIRIEQRNGRIDRFGQRKQPQFAAMILTSATPGAKDDTTVAEKLLAREQAAHLSLGTAETVTGLYDAKAEEDRLVRDLLAGKTAEQSLDESPQHDVLAELLAPTVQPTAGARAAQVSQPSLFASTATFVDEALRELYGTGNPLGVTREDNVLRLIPPDDLKRRLSVLPPSYLKEQRINERLLLTFDRDTGDDQLAKAVSGAKTTWPAVSFASDLHPMIEWLVDKVLVRFGRLEAPVLAARVTEPVVLVQGMYSNAFGRPTVVEWMAVSGLPDQPIVRPMFEVLAEAEIGPNMINKGHLEDMTTLQGLVKPAVAAARGYLAARRAEWDTGIAQPLQEHLHRLNRWEQLSLFDSGTITARKQEIVRDTVSEQRHLANSLRTSGQPFLRVLAVLEAGA
ncbi:DEAD/DEAH box helicase [Actinocrispum wychmicini]|uniref:SNF2 domain-containing protein n=1 Tax=Actinocrispum wychmicini TaxID=1213861 RepID=A0A4R2JYN4_9PSEU|nr:DEAD/DEAH box helicase [Actinocrispum wychmicini]TCO59225.1 SNF2 domain-containing protein [Actinocrispum wychmicini]